MSEQTETRTTSVAQIGAVAIDLAQTPDYGGAQGSHLRSTGRGYLADDGTVVAYAEVMTGARPDDPADADRG